METLHSIFQSIWTILVFVFFLGIVFWAYSSRNKQKFDEAARDIIDDDDSVEATRKDKHDV